jgi:hypothetical protein
VKLSAYLLAASFSFALTLPIRAQFKSADVGSSVRLGEEQTSKYQVGATIAAINGPVKNVQVLLPVPFDWPEQEAKIAEENLPAGAKIKGYQKYDGVRRLILFIPKIAGSEEITCSVTFDVKRRMVLPPADPSQLQIPKKASRELAKYLKASPYIETGKKEIVELAKAAVADRETAWDKVAAICETTREKVEYRTSDLKGAFAALKDGFGDCEELTSLFIALCRVNDIPARTVWVSGHCFAEFYLETAAGEGYWMPCQIAGAGDFPEMPDFRPILQKGDSFKVPEEKLPQRYVHEVLTGIPLPGSGSPTVKWIYKTEGQESNASTSESSE